MRFEDLTKEFQQVAIDEALDAVELVYTENDEWVDDDTKHRMAMELVRDRTYHLEFDGRYNEYVLMVD